MNFSQQNTGDEEITLEMTPLIDMVFQLLIFFLLTTTFAVNVKEGGMEVDLPRAKTKQISAMARQITIAVLKDGRVVLGGETVDPESLKATLARARDENPDTMVVVQADRTVPHHRVVDVMDVAATLGLKRLAIATVEQ